MGILKLGFDDVDNYCIGMCLAWTNIRIWHSDWLNIHASFWTFVFGNLFECLSKCCSIISLLFFTWILLLSRPWTTDTLDVIYAVKNPYYVTCRLAMLELMEPDIHVLKLEVYNLMIITWVDSGRYVLIIIWHRLTKNSTTSEI